MAINKKVENEYGAQFEYHKIREVKIKNTSNGIQLVMTVDSYLDKQARVANKTPTTRQCIINNADFALQPFYALLKAKFPDFKKAYDDMDNSFKGEIVVRDTQFIQQSSDFSMITKWKENKGV